MKITAVGEVGDFQTADIDKLMNEKLPEVKGPTVSDIFDEYDRQLLSFENDVSQKRTWPAPIRKRVCIK